jgi:serine/threonine protein kinase
MESFSNLNYAYNFFSKNDPPFENLIGYKPMKKLGSGSFGATILYQNDRNEKKVVKISEPRGKSEHHKEISILKVLGGNGRCTKNNIACFNEVIKFPELYFYSMDYIEGTILWEYLNNLRKSVYEPIYLDICENMFLSASKSIEYIHSMGVIHNDIKGNNIMVKIVNGNYTPIIIDFGLSETRTRNAKINISPKRTPWHPESLIYYTGRFSDAIPIDYYSLKKTFSMPNIPRFDMLRGIPEMYNTHNIYKLCYIPESGNLEYSDWRIFFDMISKKISLSNESSERPKSKSKSISYKSRTDGYKISKRYAK